jgi:hypothetical protein
MPTRDERGRPEYLVLIHEVNGIAPETFGATESVGPWWAGGTVEEYADARVIHREDGTSSIVAKTEHGNALIRQAAASLDIHVTDTVTVE